MRDGEMGEKRQRYVRFGVVRASVHVVRAICVGGCRMVVLW